MHKKSKDVAGTYKKPQTSTLDNKSNYPILTEEEVKSIWEQYIGNLFSDQRKPLLVTQDARDGPKIPQAEIGRAISSAQNKKSPCPVEIPIEILKASDGENIGQIIKVFNVIYDTGIIPEDWLNSAFVTIPKKMHPKTCRN